MDESFILGMHKLATKDLGWQDLSCQLRVGCHIFIFNKLFRPSPLIMVVKDYINPTNNEEQWPEVNDGSRVIPPPIGKRQRGRKATARMKEPEEIENAKNASKCTTSSKGKEKLSRKGLSTMTCSICHATGHNKRHHQKEKGNTLANVGAKRQKSNSLRMSDLQNHQRTDDFLGTQASQSNQVSQVINQGPVV